MRSITVFFAALNVASAGANAWAYDALGYHPDNLVICVVNLAVAAFCAWWAYEVLA